MLIDLLCTDNYVSYNVKLAHLLGLNTSIYLTELLNINTKAIQKQKMTDDFFTVDRKYITLRTTMSIDEQKRIEDQLLEIGILNRSDVKDSTMSLNITLLTSLLMSTDEKLIEKIKKISVKSKNNSEGKITKRQAQANALKQYIKCENQELKQAYLDWIDGVYANPNGFLSKRSIEIFQKTIDDFSQRNLDLALQIITIATVNGYRDATWAINLYMKEHNISYRIPAASVTVNTPQKIAVSEEVF